MAEGDQVKREGNPIKASVLFTLFLFSAAMFILPIASYFATVSFFSTYYYMPQSDSYIYAVIVSVVVVHIVIAGYIVVAFKEEDNPAPIKQD
jgi:hypothetical protein